MAFKWEELYKIAEILQTCDHNGASEEAFLRSATNRAYFTAYGVASTYAVKNLGYHKNKSVDDHAKIREIYRQKNRGAIADHLQDLRNWRNQCDYDDEIDNPEAVLAGAMRRARQVIAKLVSTKEKPS